MDGIDVAEVAACAGATYVVDRYGFQGESGPAAKDAAAMAGANLLSQVAGISDYMPTMLAPIAPSLSTGIAYAAGMYALTNNDVSPFKTLPSQILFGVSMHLLAQSASEVISQETGGVF